MKLTLEKFNEYIVTFATGVIAPAAKELNTKFKIGFAHEFGMLGVNAEQLEGMKSIGIADKDGNIDLDMLKRGIYAGLKESGEFYVEKLGIYLSKPDFDKFFHLCETGGAVG